LAYDPGVGGSAAISDVLTGDGHWSTKIDAAIALAGFAPMPIVIQALVSGVQDDEYLVRRHSAQTLLTLTGRHTTIEDEPDLWAKIRAERAQAWGEAAAELARPWTR